LALVDELLAYTDAQAVAVWSPSASDPETLVIGLQLGLPDEYVAYGNQMSKMAIAKEKAPIYQSWQELAEVIVPRPSESNRLPFKNWYEVLGLCEIFTCPLVHEGQVVAVLALYYPETGNSSYRFRRRHTRFQELCNQTAAYVAEHQKAQQPTTPQEFENA
jgi:GAF domain-containing protein